MCNAKESYVFNIYKLACVSMNRLKEPEEIVSSSGSTLAAHKLENWVLLKGHNMIVLRT